MVAVTAPPVEGRANAAVLRAVADALGLRAGDVAVRRGAAGRDKLLTVTSSDPDLPVRVALLRDGP